MSSPGDPKQKAAVEAYWQTLKAYRAKVRTCLMQNGYLDDPDKPKKLSEAIDFKGTCEDMCPEFEKVTRIMEHDVQGPEKELSSDGQSLWPSPSKMIKALARSAAGQDAPLPEDVRSPAALRRTLDYLVDTVLADKELETVHSFLWNRTRAIRRDFVFQQSSMLSHELVDQVYCLELITRFHVVALHQMSRQGIVAEDFSEQQEVEQLGKALLSLIHAYEDCDAQGIPCENEAEFKAYYIIFNSHNPAILEAVQDWGWKAWGESGEIRTAVSLVETLQNIWDMTGPLRPHSATDIAQNAFHRFFTIVEDATVSYTMACFAEIHFNKVRKAALKTILAGYRKQRDQTRDWTLAKLNVYLRFDDEQDIISFGEAYGLHFEEYDGEDCLAFDSDDSMSDPFPQMKQHHSYKVVERKRGESSLPDVIHLTVYESLENPMFLPESPSGVSQPSQIKFPAKSVEFTGDVSLGERSFAQPKASGSVSSNSTDQTFPKSQNQPPLAQPYSSPFKLAVPAQESTSVLFTPSQLQQSAPNSGENSASKLTSGEQSGKGNRVFSFSGESQSTTTSNIPFTSSPTTADSPKISTSASSSTPTSFFNSPGLNNIKPDAPQNNVSGPFQSPKLSSFPGTNTPLASTLQYSATNSDTKSSPSNLSTSFALEPVSETPKVTSYTPFQQQANPASPLTPNFNGPSNTLKAVQNKPPSVAPMTQKLSVDSFAKWVALGEGGLTDQFIEYTVENVLREAVNQFITEETAREDQIARDAADNFRYRSLVSKYGDIWRKNAHLLWLRRKGREAREARRRMAEDSRASKIGPTLDIVEDFRKSQGSTKQKSMEKKKSETDTVVNDPKTKDKVNSVILRSRQSSNSDSAKTRRKKLIPNGNSPKPSNHRRIQSENGKGKLLHDPAHLPGGSMIHVLPNWSMEQEMNPPRQPSGVKTDYFRLKARGIMTLPDGTPLAKTAAVHLLPHKRSFDSITKQIAPDYQEDDSLGRSIPAEYTSTYRPKPSTLADPVEDIEVIKARARAVMAQDKEMRHKNKKRQFADDDDEELFAKAKRIRDQMDEGAEWYRAENENSLSRSAS
jgi:hypothetical protein